VLAPLSDFGTNPNLGTWQELHDAIAYARSKGIKMILFGKLYWADLTTQWYNDELYKYAATDPYGIPYQASGYSYTTPTQLAGINNRRRAIMDVQSQEYRGPLGWSCPIRAGRSSPRRRSRMPVRRPQRFAFRRVPLLC
jgi:hypothetical protein